MGHDSETGWLLLMHQIPPKPGYLRVMIARRLHRIGAVAIKNTVYVLPKSNEGREDFQWMVRKIVAGGGEATICEARFVEGLSDQDIVKLFRDARNADYHALAKEMRELSSKFSTSRKSDPPRVEAEIIHLKRRLEEIIAIDFFRAPGRKAAESALAGLRNRLKFKNPAPMERSPFRPGDYRGRTWVTRKDIRIDRMASAWLIRRFIDPEARFLFVSGKGYEPRKKELRFDMFEGEFTHDGDRCTFEVLVDRMKLSDPALRHIAEIVHDIDLKDGKFRRDEAAGLDHLMTGMAHTHKKDEKRLVRATMVFDDLHQFFKTKRD